MITSEGDARLVRRAQRGDSRAFDLLVLKYQSRVATLVARFVQNPAEVQDVTQEAFLKAYKALPKFRGDSAFYTWLYRIATNTAKNYLAAVSRRPTSDIDVTDAGESGFSSALNDVESPEHIVLGEELAIRISEVISALPEELRKALTLREFDGLSYEEIAKVMQCPVGTVRSRIFRAREAIDAGVM